MAGEAFPAAPEVVLLRSCLEVVVRQRRARQGTPGRVGSPQEGEACLQRQQQQDGGAQQSHGESLPQSLSTMEPKPCSTCELVSVPQEAFASSSDHSIDPSPLHIPAIWVAAAIIY